MDIITTNIPDSYLYIWFWHTNVERRKQARRIIYYEPSHQYYHHPNCYNHPRMNLYYIWMAILPNCLFSRRNSNASFISSSLKVCPTTGWI